MPDPHRPPSGFLPERVLAIAILVAMTALPLIEIVARKVLEGGIPGSIPLVQHLTLLITFVGAVLAAHNGRLLALSTARFLPESWTPALKVFTNGLGAGISVALAYASWNLVEVERAAPQEVAWGISAWVFLMVMPLGFLGVAAWLLWEAGQGRLARALSLWGLLVPAAFAWWPAVGEWPVRGPGLLAIVIATALGLPIFAALGGAACLLFWYDMTPIAAVPTETYRLAASPMLPAIPLFTLAGYLLAEGGASHRITRLSKALVGWMPGGLAIVATLVLAFFTPLTGASGVTILSMGAVLLPALTEGGYPERTSLGLVTVSGSIGLLFPPSLPVILYAFYAEQPIEKLFVGGLLPGFLLVAVVAGYAAVVGARKGVPTTPFSAPEARTALWEAKWDLFLPILVLTGIFGGFTTLVEAAALTVVYAFFIECVVFRSLSVTKDLPRIFLECATLVGGFMIILGVALGLTNWLIFEQIPDQALAWVQEHIESKYVFLLALNLFLIAVGALMDIYSAIIVVVPLITPIGAAFGIDPIHMGIIFLANMELGYLMPPMGENLFLSAFRFDKSLIAVYRATFPYMLMLLAAVLIITYWPAFTLGPASLAGP